MKSKVLPLLLLIAFPMYTAILSGFWNYSIANDEIIIDVPDLSNKSPMDKFPSSFSPQISGGNQTFPENETTFAFLSERYGFTLLFPENREIFRTFPVITFDILNETTVFSYDCLARISNTTNRTGTDWFSFSPSEENDQSVLIHHIVSFWDATLETVPIYIEFSHSNPVAQYNFTICRDVTAPIVVFGYELDEEGDVVPHLGSFPYFSDHVTLYFDIVDNCNNMVSLFYTVNNQGFYHDIEIIAGEDIHLVHNLFQVTIPLWEELHEGENLIPFLINDTAGNPSLVQWIGFIKDSEAPDFSNYGIKQHWLYVGETPLSEYKNPFSNVYEIQETPIFHFSFFETDIWKISLFLDVPFVYNISEMTPIPSGTDDNEDLLVPKGEVSTRIMFNARQINSSLWEIGIPIGIWNEVGLQPVNVEIFVEDYAGNVAEFDFILIRTNNPLFFTYSKWIVLTFTVLILFLGSISAVISSKVSHLPRIPVEITDHIKSIDHDLLDLVLHTVDPILAQNFLAYLHRLGDHINLDYVTPPDLRSLLHTSFQPIDLKEIHSLITTFKMEPLSQENFLREMLALSPEERKEFLKMYMEDNFDQDDLNDHNLDIEDI